MSLEKKNQQDIHSEDDFVPVVYARDEEDADQYRQLLEDHDIEVVLGDEDWEGLAVDELDPGGSRQGLPVLVHATFLEEATEIIADREDDEGFVAEDEEAVHEVEDDDFDLAPGKGPDAFFHEESEDTVDAILHEDDAEADDAFHEEAPLNGFLPDEEDLF